MFIDDSITEPIKGTNSNTEENSESFHHLNSLNDSFNMVFSMNSQNSMKGTESIVQHMYSAEQHVDNQIHSGNNYPAMYTNPFLTSMVDE